MEDDYDGWLVSRPTLVQDRNHPNHWRNRAADLKASAGALWHSMGAQDSTIATELGYAPGYRMSVACWPVYHMLCGLSLELTMKAVLAQRGPTPADFKGHKFANLHQQLRLPLSKDKRKLLQFYEDSLVWAGRYPTPLDATDEKLLKHYELASEVLTKPVELSQSGVLRFKVSSGATDWEHFVKLWDNYALLFNEALGYRVDTPNP
jgi:hypothetical protein